MNLDIISIFVFFGALMMIIFGMFSENYFMMMIGFVLLVIGSGLGYFSKEKVEIKK